MKLFKKFRQDRKAEEYINRKKCNNSKSIKLMNRKYLSYINCAFN